MDRTEKSVCGLVEGLLAANPHYKISLRKHNSDWMMPFSNSILQMTSSAHQKLIRLQ